VFQVPEAVLGMGWLAFIGTALGWWREWAKHQQEIRKYLGEMRARLAQRPDLLSVVELLRTEQRAASAHASPPTPRVSGVDLRQLVAFLEPIGIYLASEPSARSPAYEVFAEEVLLCYRSAVLWEGDGCSDTYWTDFKKFARGTESRVRREGIRRLGPCR
jgi:hypothetical protein